jgi:MinD-like ATPase involved in chromosome partitioning or flagellar assembly
MYVTTFYSYKGGVGRTMALINVALLLARAGKRVLVVDFDLEAPGIPSFEQFRQADSRPGVVDYVCAYRDTGRAPDVRDFIVHCADEDSIWLMPAGRYTQPGYAEKLYSIDWKDLYDNHDGFLMFEDLRNQWASHEAAFDYVLIDSRTGHTDVGGICTRQLPNAVVVMFLPNKQNIEGLMPIVAAIREESSRPQGHHIDLHFCPSNVPDLDDEDDILRSKLEAAREALGPQATVIHHYNSLELLTQPAFAVSRPKSKLARQYKALMQAIIERNFEDPAGAELALTNMPERYEEARRNSDQLALFDIEADAAQLGSLHADNGKIAWLLSIVYSRMGAIEDELSALNVAIDAGFERNRALIRRARLLSSLNRKEPALADLNRLLDSGTTTVFEILPIIDLLRALEKAWISPVQKALEQLQVSVPAYVTLMRSLMTERDKLPLVVEVGQRARSLSDEAFRHPAIRSYFILALIGLGRFQMAMDTIGTEEEVLASNQPADIFNFAIAKWGIEGKPSAELFERVIKAIDEAYFAPPDANVFQCLALSAMVLERGDDAREALEFARSRARTGEKAFSCWRYLEVTGREMVRDLEAMETLVDKVPAAEPDFFAEARKLV